MKHVKRWSIPSNSGRDTISFEVQSDDRSQDMLECAVKIYGRFWHRPAASTQPPEFGKMTDDHNFTLSSVLMRVSYCDQLLADCDNWLRTQTPFIRELSFNSDQTILFQVEKRGDLITTADHPAFTFYYGSGICRLEVFFVVDQSCIRSARDELAATLSSLS